MTYTKNAVDELWVSAIACSNILLNISGLDKSKNQYDSELYTQKSGSNKSESSLKEQLSQFSKAHKVRLKLHQISIEKIKSSQTPLAFKQKDGGFVILARISDEQALIQFSDKDTPEIISHNELSEMWDEQVIFLQGSAVNFDFSWFIPEFVRHRKIILEILFFSFILQIMALVTPLFFQVIMDKVLVHQALSTLDVLVVVLVAVGLFEVVLKGIREYIFVHTTSRIDIHLGIKLFRHLLGLPLLYFKQRQVGAIITRVQELSSIRDFLTGSMLTLCVDVVFTFVFFAVMAWISPKLTLIVLASLPFYFFLAWRSTKPLQGRIEEQFRTTAINTSFLNESVSGAETLKSLAVEPQMQRQWEAQTQELVKASFRTQALNAVISHSVMLLQKVTSVAVIWVGANLVMSLDITIGQLIAFNMMASHVSQPIAKLVELWQQFVQTRVAIDNLGDMLNLPIEKNQSDVQPEHPLKGNIAIRNLSFRYQPNQDKVLSDINLNIKAGETLGIVGPSGSGKSTLSRLLMRLYLPLEGDIFIDGNSLSRLDPVYVRNQIGFVLQENFLFHLTVRENIALKYPTALFDDVVEAAKLAGAHDFIIKLPKSYDTLISEGGSSLSGGQRQRIAIARALMADPRILIFDEATSALDDESQAIIQGNMKAISKGRTVITIAHRLSTVSQCNRIITLEQGSITEDGTHQNLLSRNGTYAHLWQLQQTLKEVV